MTVVNRTTVEPCYPRNYFGNHSRNRIPDPTRKTRKKPRKIFFLSTLKFVYKIYQFFERGSCTSFLRSTVVLNFGNGSRINFDGSKDRPAVAIFLRTMAFSEAANAALATIATTYMSEVLQMNGLEIGMTILIVLIFGLPGSWLGHYCTTYWYDNNPVASTKLCLIVYAITTAAACITLIEPSRKNWAYFYGAGWGVCQGWIHPQHTTIFVTITVVGDDGDGEQQQQQQSTTTLSTGGQDDACHQASTTTTAIPPKQQQQGVVELMGVFLFACQILSFLPPLVFTALNEAGVSMQWGLASLVVYFVIGYVGLIQMGDYRSALLMMDRVVNNSNSSTTLAQNHDDHHHHNDINRSSNTSHDVGEDFKANNDLGGRGGGGGGGVLT